MSRKCVLWKMCNSYDSKVCKNDSRDCYMNKKGFSELVSTISREIYNCDFDELDHNCQELIIDYVIYCGKEIRLDWDTVKKVASFIKDLNDFLSK